ncbi:amino acid aminotransferase [Asticcacaulis sp. AND118]|uniref:amino acid aminotransferase n=1 Tax=Asticcacaulis sp. AND118 TaxID=2840468 RepID=UPI001D000E79|nr:amino acid aminotransferase [Asticcacaulis sp. AND118]UDF04887.1 aspartate/tyrosine/aromatic aminotransferase [Asticcacaulis sp. AND118]
MNTTLLAAPLFATLKNQPSDSLLELIQLFRADPRAEKIDLGVGVYKDEQGRTPVMAAVKQAESALLSAQESKSYLGTAGDMGFVDALIAVVFGEARRGDRSLSGLQTPGGTGALRLAAELLNRARPGVTVWVGSPTWINHFPIFQDAGLKISEYKYFDRDTQSLTFTALRKALETAQTGDVVLLHAGCHNPTGADLSADQWREIAALCAERSLLPLIDMAYQGLGHGLEDDADALRNLLSVVPDALIAYSCNKNFALYRDRVGALFYQCADETRRERLRGNLIHLARTLWSMPPDHGAAVVRLILNDAALTQVWTDELATMRGRVRNLRAALAMAHPGLSFLTRQNGLFSTLPLSPEQVLDLRTTHGIYMASSGRVNLAGLATAQVPALAKALKPFL